MNSMTHLGDYPIRHRPSMDPGYRTGRIAALGEDDGAEGGDGVGEELKALDAGRWGPGEEAHQELVGGRAVEPPLEVGGYDPVHRPCIARSQGFVEGAHDPATAGIGIFLRCSLCVRQLWSYSRRMRSAK